MSAYLQVEKGRITGIKFYGDYFGSGESADVEGLLLGRSINPLDIAAALSGVELGRYFRNMDKQEFVEFLSE